MHSEAASQSFRVIISAFDPYRPDDYRIQIDSLPDQENTLVKTFHWTGYAELVGIAAIIASLIFVGQQLRLDRQVAMSEGWCIRVTINYNSG